MNTKAKAIQAAKRALGRNAHPPLFTAFVRGYMAGHAAETRWANKVISKYRDVIAAARAPSNGSEGS